MLNSFLKTLNGEKADKIVWAPDITYWIAGQKDKRDWDTEIGYLNLCRELGCMPYYCPDDSFGEMVSDNVTVVTKNGDGIRQRQWQTPQGCLSEVMQYEDISHSWAITKYPVQSKDDLQVLIYILENSRPLSTDVKEYQRKQRLFAEYGGLPLKAKIRSPLPAFIVEWAGVQNGIYLLMDNLDTVQHILKLLEAHDDIYARELCELAPPLVHFCDNLTSDVYTGFFDMYMAENYRKRIQQLNQAGIKCTVHLDGTTQTLLPRLAEVGFDSIEALTPIPFSDLTVEQMNEVVDDDEVILWGGIPGPLFCPPNTWDDMQKQVERVVAAWAARPFILGVGDQIPPDGDITFVRRISDLLMNCSL